MITAPDHITSTAPKRIYLDLGDCAHLIKPEETFATYAQGEITWSEGNDSGVGIPYVRADLVPTPAASGAAPADERAAFEQWAEKRAHDTKRGSGPGYLVYSVQIMWMAWQARAALASPQVAPKGRPFFWVRQHPDGTLTGEVLSDAQIEPVRRDSGAWLPLFVGATPVQVAPNPSPSPASVLTDEQIINNIENAMNMERGLWHLVSCGELVSLFRKHLAIQGEVK